MPKFEDLTDQQRTNLASASNQLLSNPETAREFKRLWMKANPQVRFPEIEQEQIVEKQFKSRDEKIEELSNKLLEQEADKRRQDKRQAAAARGLDPDAVENLIVERGKSGRVIDYESAMELMELQQQAAAATPATQSWQDPRNDAANKTIKEMLASDNPGEIARRIAHETIDELRGRRRRA
jgi:hypothetical protein